jgi:hypothetical protein
LRQIAHSVRLGRANKHVCGEKATIGAVWAPGKLF